MKRRHAIALVALAGIALAVPTVLFWRRGGEPVSAEAACGSEAPIYWYDPMRPAAHFDKPGKSPFMDMPLTAQCSGRIDSDTRTVEKLGVRMAPVTSSRFTRDVDTVGLVGIDEHRIEAIQVREPGWVEVLDVRAAGDPVRRGQRLAGVYSPALLALQQELLIARASNDPALLAAARGRLALFGLSTRQVADLERSGRPEQRVYYYAPFDGFVMELGTRQGAQVQPGATLFQLAGLDTVWITAEVPEMQAAWVVPGDRATISPQALPGTDFEGRVDYLYPELASATRSLRVRVVVKNPQLRLRPGMFAAVHLRGTPLEQVLTVPTEAVIKTGTRSVVIVADDATHFRPAAVRVGLEQAGRSQILDGLSVGQQVVASGQFLLDSEANLRAAFERLGAVR
ncbi:MAG: efflux RND transporter periplasmic adaptor subunit [Steroidobacteraceae bacterium]